MKKVKIKWRKKVLTVRKCIKDIQTLAKVHDAFDVEVENLEIYEYLKKVITNAYISDIIAHPPEGASYTFVVAKDEVAYKEHEMTR